MKTLKKDTFLLSLSMLLLLMLSACSASDLFGSLSSSKSPAEVLQDSATAMKQLKSAHFALSFSATVSGLSLTTDSSSSSTTSSFTATSSSSSSTITSSSSSTPSTINLTLNANGDEVLPDQTSLNLTTNPPGSTNSQSHKLAVVVKGKQVYIQNSSGKWYQLNLSSTSSQEISNLLTDTQIINYNNLLPILIKDANFTDHGIEKLNGENLRHMTVTFGKNALKDLINALGVTNSLTSQQQQSLNNVLNMAKLENAGFDVWIDEATSYVHHMELKFNIATNASSQATATATSSTSQTNSSTVTAAVDLTTDFSKFNQTVSIPTPANAIPTTDPSVIFS